MRMLAAALVLASSAAHADFTAEVSAGGGSQVGASDYGTASASVAAEISQPSAPLYRRGLAFADDQGGVWMYTGADGGERDFARVDASATWLGTTGVGQASAAVGAQGWKLEYGVAYQPVGDLRELFWRSGRGVIAWTFGMDVPPMVTWGDAWTRGSIGGIEFSITQRSLTSSAGLVDGGSDGIARCRFFRWREPAWSLDLFDVNVTGFSLPGPETATAITSYDANDFGFDLAALDWKLTPELELRASGGADNVQPKALVTEIGDDPSMTTPVPSAWTPRYWLELAQRTDDRAVTVGAGSWARLDPTGNAADAGQLASASYDTRIGRLHLQASAETGRLVRRMIGALAPPSIAPAGTRMWMGRGELAASLRVARHIELTGDAWLERSDRDDPRWLVPATGAITTHAGADLGARWHSRSR